MTLTVSVLITVVLGLGSGYDGDGDAGRFETVRVGHLGRVRPVGLDRMDTRLVQPVDELV